MTSAAYYPGMRLTFLLALFVILAACQADPVLLPDAGPCSSACGAGTVCSGGACVAVDGGGVDVVAVADAGPDAQAPEDRGGALDVPVAVADAGPADAGVDAPAVDAGRCPNGPTATCDGRNVGLVSGERDGGLVHHCGACGVTCAAGEVCDACRCAR